MKAVRVTVSTLSAVLFYLSGQAWATLEKPYEIAWIRQFGTNTYDYSTGVSTDGMGHVYVTGYTFGSLSGSDGASGGFIRKYDSAGNQLWTRQFGGAVEDIAIDDEGVVYIAGTTTGGPNGGPYDVFIRRYDSAGNLLWMRRLGTTTEDLGFGVSADGLGNVYTSGHTKGSLGGTNAGLEDAFVGKYDPTGALSWILQIGTSAADFNTRASADGLGNVYVTGYTYGSLGGPNAGSSDAFVSKCDSAGSLLWMRQLGTSAKDVSWDISADGLGNLYISGTTEGSLGGPNAGKMDAFIGKYDSTGNLLWTHQFGTSGSDSGSSISADGLGNVYICGWTEGSLGGTRVGGRDAFVSEYDSTGNLLWTRQFGTTSDDGSFGISVDGLGNVYTTGLTYGSLGGPHAGYEDIFVVKLVVPEPETSVLLGLGLVAIRKMRRNHGTTGRISPSS